MIKLNGNRQKQQVVDLLCRAFADNQSVIALVGENANKKARLKRLMEYAFDECLEFGEVYINKDFTACSLSIKKDRKRTTIKSLKRNLVFAIDVIGVKNLFRTLRKQKLIDKAQDSECGGKLINYLWFLAVEPQMQGNGIGSRFLEEIIVDSEMLGIPIYLETSTKRNLPWYEKFGFRIYDEFDFGYKLSFLKREVKK